MTQPKAYTRGGWAGRWGYKGIESPARKESRPPSVSLPLPMLGPRGGGSRSAPRASIGQARLQQVLANLLRNAIGHTPPGGIVAVEGGPDRDGALAYRHYFRTCPASLT